MCVFTDRHQLSSTQLFDEQQVNRTRNDDDDDDDDDDDELNRPQTIL